MLFLGQTHADRIEIHMIELDCPHCKHPLRIDPRFAGQSGACKHCNGALTIPGSAITGNGSDSSVPIPALDTIELWRDSWRKYLTPAQLNRVNQKVESSITDGLSPEALWETLEEIQQLNVEKALVLKKYKNGLLTRGVSGDTLKQYIEKRHGELLNAHRKEIATIEQHVVSTGNEFARAKRDGKTYKVWITIGDDLQSDSDVANEAQGWIPIEQPFQSGHLAPPSRPSCRCTVSYRKTEPDKVSIMRAEERIRATAKARTAMGI